MFQMSAEASNISFLVNNLAERVPGVRDAIATGRNPAST